MRDIYKYSIFKGSCKRKELTYAQKVNSVVNQIKIHRINCSMSEEEKKNGRVDQGIFRDVGSNPTPDFPGGSDTFLRIQIYS